MDPVGLLPFKVPFGSPKNPRSYRLAYFTSVPGVIFMPLGPAENDTTISGDSGTT